MGQMMAIDRREIEALAAKSNYPEYGISGRCNYITEKGVTGVGLSGNKAQHLDLTVDLGTGLLVPDYFKGPNAVVSTDKCDVCHDSLATTFHEGSGRGGGGIQVCKNCHAPIFAGGHLETQSRSIESYVHAIHAFQAFDTDGVERDGLMTATLNIKLSGTIGSAAVS